MEYFQNLQGSLFKLTRGEYDFILDIIREENPVIDETSIDTYTKDDFLDEVYMAEKTLPESCGRSTKQEEYHSIGRSGVGKTFAARRLA